MEKLTEEQRISVIRHAHQNSKTFSPKESVEDFIASIKLEDIVTEFGTLDAKLEDLEDESQFLFSDSAEDIDEEDEDLGLSDEMQGVYKNN